MPRSTIADLNRHRATRTSESSELATSVRILNEIVLHLSERVEVLETRERLERPRFERTSAAELRR